MDSTSSRATGIVGAFKCFVLFLHRLYSWLTKVYTQGIIAKIVTGSRALKKGRTSILYRTFFGSIGLITVSSE